MHLRTLAVVAAAAAAPALAVVGLRPAVATTIAAPATAFAPDREITVTGEAEIDVVPDRATIHFAVDVARAKTAAEASLDASQRTAKILKAASKAGIEPASVKTDALTVNPVLNYHKDGTSDVVGFSASRGITVCITDLKNVDAVIEALMSAGANRIDSLTFDSSDLTSKKKQARLLAVRAAREKAEVLAKELGVTLGKPRTVSEGNLASSQPMTWMNVHESYTKGAFVAGAFSPGQINVNSDVSVVFDLL